MNVREFVTHHYRHFNAATVREAAEAYEAHLAKGGKMFMTLAGAMSTAELGLSLAELIRQEKVHAICCTGANLEEDLFNLMAHDHYERIPNWRNLTREQEKDLEARGRNRVTDTCIPEEEAFRELERPLLSLWQEADKAGKSYFPHEYLYRLIRERTLAKHYQIPEKDSWLAAAAKKDLPIFTPGWEDSTTGNIFVSHVLNGDLKSHACVKSGTEHMSRLANWYLENCGGDDGKNAGIGFFQVGGGIAGDFPICVVPMIHQDLGRECPYWAYFCQISDSTTSYGSYSGAIPSEKITWGKLDVHTPMFVIESDATIVAPLMFAYLLGW